MSSRTQAAATPVNDSAPPPALARLKFGAPVAEVIAIVARDGGVILEDALTPEQVARINAELDPHLADYHTGSLTGSAMMKEFWGALTKRRTNIFLRSDTYRTVFLENPVLHAYAEAMFTGVSDAMWLNSTQAIEIMPGEDAQMLHRDASNYPVFDVLGPDAPEVTCNFLLALVDVDEACGATRVIPGSHRWDYSRRFRPSDTIPAELRAGSLIFFSGKLVHGGGANTTRDVRRRVITTSFNPGFLVPEEAFPFTVPLEKVRAMSPRLQQMLGFRSFHQSNPPGGSLWQSDYEELAEHLKLS